MFPSLLEGEALTHAECPAWNSHLPHSHLQSLQRTLYIGMAFSPWAKYHLFGLKFLFRDFRFRSTFSEDQRPGPFCPTKVELSQGRDQMLSQHAGETAHHFANRRQLWSAGIATVLLGGFI